MLGVVLVKYLYRNGGVDSMVEIVLVKYLYSNRVYSVFEVVLVKYLYSNGGVDSVLGVILVKYLYNKGGALCGRSSINKVPLQ